MPKARGPRGFSVQNLWRMRQSFDTYSGDANLSPLVRDDRRDFID